MVVENEKETDEPMVRNEPPVLLEPANSARLPEDIEPLVGLLQTLHFQLGWASHRRLEQELDAYQLTVPQFMVMKCIQETGHGCTMSFLAERSYQVSATMTGIVDRLVDRGLVQRERNPRDRRVLWVVLTPDGQVLLKRVMAFRRVWLERFVLSLSEEDRASLMRSAQQYLTVIRETFEETVSEMKRSEEG